MTDAHDFDALGHAAQQGNTKIVGERDFVRAAMTLDAWFMIGVAPDDAPGELEPMIARVQGAPHVVLFTDSDRAEGFARAHAEKRGDAAPPPTLEATPDEAAAFVLSVREHGVQGAHFNDGPACVTIDAARIDAIINSGD